MATRKNWSDEDERPTNPGGRRSKSRSDSDFDLGGLMVEAIHLRQRLEILEARVEVLEAAPKNLSLAPGSSLPPAGKQRLYALVRKTVTTAIIIIAAAFSALKELGYLGR